MKRNPNEFDPIDEAGRKPGEIPHPRVRLPHMPDTTLFGGWGIKL